MKEMLQIIIESLVDNKEEVSIVEIEKGKTIVYQVKVDAKDMGKVIGKQGKIAKSIRTVARAIATKEDKRVNVEFVEE